MSPEKPSDMEIALASDHAGFSYKGKLLVILRKKGYSVEDLGVFSEEASDYPDIAQKMAEMLSKGDILRGILICGSGVGVCVAVNKFFGIGAGVCHDCYSARQAVEHDDIKVLCLGSRVLGFELMQEIAFAFLNARFSGEDRHKRRLAKLRSIERSSMKSVRPEKDRENTYEA